MHPPVIPSATNASSAMGLILARDKSVICARFFHTGTCDVDNCPYAHFTAATELPMPESICYFHGKPGTTCKRDGCRFFHGSREAFESLKAAGATTYRPAWFLQVKDPVAGALESNPNAKDEEWQAVLKRVPHPRNQSKSAREKPHGGPPSPPVSPHPSTPTVRPAASASPNSSSPIAPSSPLHPVAGPLPYQPLTSPPLQGQYVQTSHYLPISPPSHVLMSGPHPLAMQSNLAGYPSPPFAYSPIPQTTLSMGPVPGQAGVGLFVPGQAPFAVHPPPPPVGLPRY